MIIVERGNTKQINVTFKNSALVATDPDLNAATITIYFQDGTSYLSGKAMTKSTTGVYYYQVTTLSTDSIGIYNVEISATFSTIIKVMSREQFMLVDIISGE